MKQFRSSKALKVMEVVAREDPNLRKRIKQLQEQVDDLQQNHLNILIPRSETLPPTPNYQLIIAKLRQQILGLRQDSEVAKNIIKRLQSDQEHMRITHLQQITSIRDLCSKIQEEKLILEQEKREKEEEIKREIQRRNILENINVEINVENKCMREENQNLKRKWNLVEGKYSELQSCVAAVIYSSKIYKSKNIAVTAIETNQLSKMKEYIIELERQLQNKNEVKVRKKSFGPIKKDLGEEIVRLKNNIDFQLGLNINDDISKSFLKAYNGTQNMFNNLIAECRLASDNNIQ